MRAIHRDDGELCGHVRPREGRWEALAVFGGVLGVAASEAAAEAIVRATGLSALAERWLLATGTGEAQVVRLQEASPEAVTLSIGAVAYPGAATARITRAELETGRCSLRRDP